MGLTSVPSVHRELVMLVHVGLLEAHAFAGDLRSVRLEVREHRPLLAARLGVFLDRLYRH